MRDLPFVTCLCATYRRPECLRNAIACYLAQDYPAARRELLILDDGNQYHSQVGDSWRLISTNPRYGSGMEKMQAAADFAMPCTDIFAVWDDDDVYLPWHLSAHVAAMAEADYSMPSSVFSNYGRNRQSIFRVSSVGGYHGSWAFRRPLFDRVGGYPQIRDKQADQVFGASLAAHGKGADPCEHFTPSYVYRFGMAYHASAFDDAAGNWWDQALHRGDGRWVGTLIPEMDAETQRIYAEVRQ